MLQKKDEEATKRLVENSKYKNNTFTRIHNTFSKYKKAMKKRELLILFILIINQILIFGQEIEELKLIKVEKKEKKISNSSQTPFNTLYDHEGNFISELNFSFSKKGYEVEFLIDEVTFKFDRFLFAIVNKKANRLYTFGKKTASDCGGIQCPIRGFKIYDLTGQLIKVDSTILRTTSRSGFSVSDKGDLYVTGKANVSNTLLIKKFNLNGILQWEKKFPLPKEPLLDTRMNIALDETLLVQAIPTSMSSTKYYYILNKESGKTIWEEKLNRPKIILFNKNDVVVQTGLSVYHQSFEEDKIETIDGSFLSYTASDKTGQFFCGVSSFNSESKMSISIFKKIEKEYVKIKEGEFLQHDIIKHSDGRMKYLVLQMESDGSLIIENSNEKYFFN